MYMAKDEKSRWQNVDIEPTLYKKIQDDKPKVLKAYLNDLLAMGYAKRHLAQKMFPDLSLVSADPMAIVVRERSGKIVAVTFNQKDGNLNCQEHGEEVCEHVKYVMVIPEMGRLEFPAAIRRNKNESAN